jgi:hypothetical protein
MKLQVRFESAPDAALRRIIAARFRLVAGGGGPWRWQDAVARFSVDGDGAPDEALAAVDVLAPIREVDRGAGFEPFARTEEAEGIDLVDVPDAAPPVPTPVPDDIRGRFVFDDHVIAAPGGRHLAFVRDARRCHFDALHLIDDSGRLPIALPVIHDYPRVAFSPDDRRMLVGGPLDVLEIDLDTSVVTRLHHQDGGTGFDVCYLGTRRAAIGWDALLLFDAARTFPCRGGRLLRAVLDGRVLVAGTEDGTFVLGLRDDEVRLLARDWRSLADVWEADGRVLCAPVSGGVCELRGLDQAWTHTFAGGDAPPEVILQ